MQLRLGSCRRLIALRLGAWNQIFILCVLRQDSLAAKILGERLRVQFLARREFGQVIPGKRFAGGEDAFGHVSADAFMARVKRMSGIGLEHFARDGVMDL